MPTDLPAALTGAQTAIATDIAQAGNSSIAIDNTATDQDIDWRILTTGDVSGGDDNNRVDHGIGRAEGTTRNKDSIDIDGRLLGIRLERIDPDVTVRIGDTAIDPHTLDPRGVLGGIAFGRPPADMRVSAADCDTVVSTQSELDAIDWEDGLAVGIRSEGPIDMGVVDGDRFPIDADGCLLAGLPIAGKYPLVRFGDWEQNDWGNCAIPFEGDRNRATGLRVEGACTEPEPKPHPDDDPKVRGIESRGDWNLIDHCETFHFTHAGLSDRGNSTEFLNVASYRNQWDGLGYGITFGGPFDVEYDDRLDTESDAWIKKDRRRREVAGSWLDRGRALRAFFDQCRHAIAGGGDPNVEAGAFVVGPRTIYGHPIDAHRPGHVRGLFHDFTYQETEERIDGPQTPAKVRGTPLEFVHFLRGSFETGDRPHPERAAVGSGSDDTRYAIEQVCIDGLTRGWWREEDRPFKNVSWHNVHFADDEGDPEFTAPASGPAAPHRLVVQATGNSCGYELEVSGELFYGFGADPGDEILRTAQRGDGAVGGSGSDSWFFTGDLVSFEKDGPAEVSVDSEAIDPAQFSAPQEPEPGDDSDPDSDSEPGSSGGDTGGALLNALRSAGVDPRTSIADVLSRASKSETETESEGN